MDTYSIRVMPSIFIRSVLLVLLVQLPLAILADPIPKDSTTNNLIPVRPSSYISINSMLFFKGGFNSNSSPQNFILGTNFNTVSTGMEISAGIPIYKYFGISGQYNVMSTDVNLSNYNIVESHFDNSYYNVGRYRLKDISGGVFFTLPTRIASFDFEIRMGHAQFNTPAYALIINSNSNNNWIVDRPAYAYTAKTYSYSFQARFFINKFLTISIRLSNYIIPKLYAPSTNFDTRMPNYIAYTNPDISFKYQCIGIGLGFRLPGLNIH